jgi:hypothetical protein
MSRRATGWALLAMAAAGAGLVAALGLRERTVDGWLVVIAGLALLAAITTVLLDRRASARRAAGPLSDHAAPVGARAARQRGADG